MTDRLYGTRVRITDQNFHLANIKSLFDRNTDGDGWDIGILEEVSDYLGCWGFRPVDCNDLPLDMEDTMTDEEHDALLKTNKEMFETHYQQDDGTYVKRPEHRPTYKDMTEEELPPALRQDDLEAKHDLADVFDEPTRFCDQCMTHHPNTTPCSEPPLEVVPRAEAKATEKRRLRDQLLDTSRVVEKTMWTAMLTTRNRHQTTELAEILAEFFTNNTDIDYDIEIKEAHTSRRVDNCPF